MKSLVSHLKSYFSQTTAHGFRYLADPSRSRLEKAAWAVAISASLIISTYLVYASVLDADRHPVISSVNTVIVQEVPFPAVTLDPGPGFTGGNHETLTRFATEVFNTLEFDCTDEECHERSAQLRKDYQWVLKTLVKNEWEEGMTNVVVNNSICIMESDLQSTLGQIVARADDEEQTYSTDDVLLLASRIIGAPLKLQVSMAEDFIRRHNLTDFDAGYASGHQCLLDAPESEKLRRLFHAVGIATRREWSMLRIEAPNDNDRLLFGDLLELNYRRNFWPTEVYRDGLPHSPDSVMDWLVKDDGGDLTINDVYSYVLCAKTQAFDSYTRVHHNFICKHLAYASMSNICGSKCVAGMGPAVSSRLSTVFSVMKYVLQPATATIKDSDFRRDVSRAAEMLPYPKKEARLNKQTDTLVLACRYGSFDRLSADCPLFSRTYTDRGIGYTFNHMKFWDLYRRTPNNQAFYDEFVSGLVGTGEIPRKAQGAGPAYAFEALLRSEQPGGPVSVAIHDPFNMPDVTSEVLKLIPGNRYTVYLTPSVAKTAKDVLDLPEKHKLCRDTTDGDRASLFARYTQSGCFFECRMKVASPRCGGCVPWNYPHFGEPVAICHKAQSDCFERYMDESAEGECDCPSDCQSVSYSIRVEKEEGVDFGALCKLNETLMPPADNRMTRALLRPGQAETILRENSVAACQADAESSVVHLKVQMATKMSNVMLRQRRTTFVDQLASLGGLVGLFTGMSLLSLFEAMVWLAAVVGVVFKGCTSCSSSRTGRNKPTV